MIVYNGKDNAVFINRAQFYGTNMTVKALKNIAFLC